MKANGGSGTGRERDDRRTPLTGPGFAVPLHPPVRKNLKLIAYIIVIKLQILII
jgi:hypothetical protein